jgi:hypothetical protein
MRPQENVAQPPCREQTGWFVKLPIIGDLNQPPRLREAKVASRHLIDRAATPPYPRRGIRLILDFMCKAPRSIR